MTFPPLPELMPQSSPMMLLDEVQSFESDRIRCGVVLGERDPFMRDGRVRAAVCLEYMAQAIAAHTGLEQRKRGLPPRPGYIINVRSLSLNCSHLSLGDRLTIDAVMIRSDVNAATFDVSIHRDAERIASGEVSVFQPPDGSPLK